MPPVKSSTTTTNSRSSTEVKRILLLEDDEAFQGIIRDFLQENFYEVVAVTNGVDGVRAVLNQEFDAIICDMMMPRLPGDMFYTAIERMRPHLCRRFIFVTGHRAVPKITDFIHRVKGTMLPKPFQLDALLGAICRVQVTSLLH